MDPAEATAYPAHAAVTPRHDGWIPHLDRVVLAHVGLLTHGHIHHVRAVDPVKLGIIYQAVDNLCKAYFVVLDAKQGQATLEHLAVLLDVVGKALPLLWAGL